MLVSRAVFSIDSFSFRNMLVNQVNNLEPVRDLVLCASSCATVTLKYKVELSKSFVLLLETVQSHCLIKNRIAHSRYQYFRKRSLQELYWK